MPSGSETRRQRMACHADEPLPRQYASTRAIACIVRYSYPEGRGRPLLHRTDRDGPALEKEGRSMAWIYLVLAGALEIIWAFYMKKSAGFTLLVPSAITLVTMAASFTLLSVSMKTLPLGTAYMIWTGIGAVGAFALGVVSLGEAATPMRLAAAGLILAGIVLMKLSTPTA